LNHAEAVCSFASPSSPTSLPLPCPPTSITRLLLFDYSDSVCLVQDFRHSLSLSLSQNQPPLLACRPNLPPQPSTSRLHLGPHRTAPHPGDVQPPLPRRSALFRPLAARLAPRVRILALGRIHPTARPARLGPRAAARPGGDLGPVRARVPHQSRRAPDRHRPRRRRRRGLLPHPLTGAAAKPSAQGGGARPPRCAAGAAAAWFVHWRMGPCVRRVVRPGRSAPDGLTSIRGQAHAPARFPVGLDWVVQLPRLLQRAPGRRPPAPRDRPTNLIQPPQRPRKRRGRRRAPAGGGGGPDPDLRRTPGSRPGRVTLPQGL